MPSFTTVVSRILPERVKAVLRLWFRASTNRARDRSSNLSVDEVDGHLVAFRKGTADEDVIRHSFANDIFFAGVPEYRAAEGDVIIEIGAHIGTFTLLAASRVGTGQVYAIEASEDSFNFLRINVSLNLRTNVSVHHLAISDKEGTVTLYHDTGNWGHSTVAKLSSSSEIVRSCTLFTFLEEHGIQDSQFMKLNCEGSEFPIILSSSRPVLRRFEKLLILYHCDLWRSNTEADLTSHLEACGFVCLVRNRTEDRGWIVAIRDDDLGI